MKYYEVCGDTFTPVLQWQPGGLLSLPPTVSWWRNRGGNERRQEKIGIIARGKKKKSTGCYVRQIIGLLHQPYQLSDLFQKVSFTEIKIYIRHTV